MLLVQQTGLKRSFTNASPVQNRAPENELANGSRNTNGNSRSGLDDLAGLELTQSETEKEAQRTNFASVAHLSAGWEVGYNRLLLRPEGVLYEDPQIQIGLRSEYRSELGCIILYFTNRSSSAIHSFTTTLDNRSAETLKTDIKGLPDTTIQPESQTQQTIMFEAKNVFTDPPTIRVSYLAGALQALTLQLPVVLHKYMDPAALGAEDFFKRWKQIGGAPRECQLVFGLTGKGRSISRTFVRQVADGFGWGVLDGVDPNSKNLVGATVLYTSEGGKFGCLMRLEPNYETNVSCLLKHN
jgi:AP-2 complex subunit alpha